MEAAHVLIQKQESFLAVVMATKAIWCVKSTNRLNPS